MNMYYARIFLILWCMALPDALAGIDPLLYEEQTFTLDNESTPVRVPKGYTLEWLVDMDRPRMLTFAPNGDLFAGSKSGKVYRLPPPYTKSEVLVDLGGYPHSVAFREGEILIARTNGLYRAPYQPGQANISRKEVKLLAKLPSGMGHNTRTVGVGPDGRIYVSLGIQRNCTDQYLGEGYDFDDQRGGVMVLKEGNGKLKWEPFASGLRNPVGFDWHPRTGVLYATNNGPDHQGFDQPPEYFSKLTAGSFHGMPWFQYDGQQVNRDDCESDTPPRPIDEVTIPVATFPARNAPLGMAFVPNGAMDEKLEFDAIVALHGSWGKPVGGGVETRRVPKLVAVRFKDGKAVRVDDLVSGFQLTDGERWARPAGVAFGPDGALYFSSDHSINALFRVRQTNPVINQH